MKKISHDIYVVEPNESITVDVHVVNTAKLAVVSLDGNAVKLAEEPFKFTASSEQDTHNMVLLLEFTQPSGGSYQLNLSGSHGGNYKSSIKQSSGREVKSLSIAFRVGSTGGGASLGIGPPAPWPAG